LQLCETDKVEIQTGKYLPVTGQEITHINQSRRFIMENTLVFQDIISDMLPIPVALRSNAWVCGLLLAGIAGSNFAKGMDICLLLVQVAVVR
jgi:hypothetical protein